MASESTAPVGGERLGGEHAVVVQLRAVSVACGGLLALGGVDLDVARGERLAILGPNGAGKTTLFNVVAGDLVPTTGTVHLQGRDCTRLPSRHRPALGVARTYQKARSFAGLTVEDNLYLAVVGRRASHHRLWPGSDDARHRERARSASTPVWLENHLQTRVSELSHGQKRQLEIGMALATDPEVLLLDEPASGLSRGERERLTELLEALPVDVTLLLIEHDMDVAFKVARRVVVMSDGKVVAAGTPEQVQADPLVHEIYLGSEALA
jgi:branched-chain amino acid transport system ATP-binding protein